jgi:tetratricopeptide (TPR) repeat protein
MMARRIRIPALMVCIAATAFYMWLAIRDYQATRLASALDIASLRQAITLAPRNAAYQNLLCRFLLFDRQEATAAIPHCRRATELDSHNSAFWLDLALGYYSVGAPDLQRQAILSAIAVDPTTPDVAWTAANFFLLQNDIPSALHQFSIVIANDPGKVTPALELCWRAAQNVRTIESILPQDPNAYLQFVLVLVTNHEWEAAGQVWSDLLLLNRGVDYQKAIQYEDALLQHRDVDAADRVWQQLLLTSPSLAGRLRKGDLVVNGGFEQSILNSGFDWRYVKQGGCSVSLDGSEFHSGSQSLSISFNGRNGDSGLFQYVPVTPNTLYTLSAWTKSEGLKSGSGVSIAVSDPYSNTAYGQTPETLGTTRWHRVETNFTTGPDVRLVAIRFQHVHGPLWAEGMFWVDDVSLQPIPQATIQQGSESQNGPSPNNNK